MAEWTTEDVREMVRFTQSHLFSLGHGRGHGPDEREEVDRNFADWLAAHDAGVKAEALEEAAGASMEWISFKPDGWGSNPVDQSAIAAMSWVLDWLRARAAAIRGEQ